MGVGRQVIVEEAWPRMRWTVTTGVPLAMSADAV